MKTALVNDYIDWRILNQYVDASFIVSKDRHLYKDDPAFRFKINIRRPSLCDPIWIQMWLGKVYVYIQFTFLKFQPKDGGDEPS